MGLQYYLEKPWCIPLALQGKGFGKLVPDKLYLKCIFYETLGYKLNLQDPKSFNEKIQWLKLYNRDSCYIKLVDKYQVKKIVGKVIGEEHIIPTLGVWDDFDEIDFDLLPDRFVLKCTHDSGGLVICRDKSAFDRVQAKKNITKSLHTDYYLLGREWPYKDVPRKIIAEEFMENLGSTDLVDYKFYCFGGSPMYCQVICNRSTSETIDFFDMDWNHQTLRGMGLPLKPNAVVNIQKPISFEKMYAAAQILSKDNSFMRVDFYEIDGKMYFGEITFYPASGFGYFEPSEWNEKLGNLIKLPKRKR